MTETMVERFPDHQPYAGAFDTIVPHLSAAQARLDETKALLQPLLPLQSRAESAALYERAGSDHWRELHTFDL